MAERQIGHAFPLPTDVPALLLNRPSIWTMKHQTIHITFPCQSHCAFSWRYIVGIPRRSNTHCYGSWFRCGLHHFHNPLSFFYKLKILSGEGYVMFSLRAKVPFSTGYVVCKWLTFLILTLKFFQKLHRISDEMYLIFYNDFSLEWSLWVEAGLFGRMVIMMGSNEGIFWGRTSTKIELYSATNIKILVPFRFGKLHKRQCKTTKNPLLTPPTGGGLILWF